MSQGTNNTNTQNAGAAGGTPSAEERIFTQAQVDAIVAERLGREKAKFADYDTIKAKADKYDAAEEANKTELQKATDKAAKLQRQLDELKQSQAQTAMRAKVAEDMKLPAGLAEFLTAADEDGCKAQAQKLLDQIKPGGYPAVPDGGEPAPAAATGKDAAWLNFAAQLSNNQ